MTNMAFSYSFKKRRDASLWLKYDTKKCVKKVCFLAGTTRKFHQCHGLTHNLFK